MPKQLTTEEWIEKAKQIHGDKYDYSRVEYISAKLKITIICKIHGKFFQTSSDHLSGNGCKCCGIESRKQILTKTTQQFINEAKQIHGDKYDYSKTKYFSAREKIIIICKEHGEFEQLPDSHLRGAGCKSCSIEYTHLLQKSNTDEFIKKANEIHGYKYDYSKVNYNKAIDKVVIICKIHGEYKTTPNNHLNGSGCSKCSKRYSYTTEEWIKKAIEKYGDKYNYSKVEYINCETKIKITCKEHGEFEQTPIHHAKGSGCPKCSLYKKYSKVSIEWLNLQSLLYDVQITHAENSNEFQIPNTKYKADGFCQDTNTVYEFHGTIYHGDPRCCNPTDYSYFGKPYGDLYKKTLEREQEIKQMGYNLVVMWEYDWNKINKSIRTLQRKFRSTH